MQNLLIVSIGLTTITSAMGDFPVHNTDTHYHLWFHGATGVFRMSRAIYLKKPYEEK